MPLEYDDEDGSWWRLSEGWPEITNEAYAKYIFANMSKVIPYGSYVFSHGDYRNCKDSPHKGDVLRIENEELQKLLNNNYNIVKEYIVKQLEFEKNHDLGN